MDHVYAGLYERIRQKCQQDGWYGGELDGPTSLHVRPDHPQRVDFAYPPANAEQLQATEAALGFSLLPLLRWLYTEVANGGFGPGAGIQGALGGYGSRTDEPTSTIVDDYHFRCQIGYANTGSNEPVRLVDLADYAQDWKPTKSGKGLLLLPYVVWPAQLVPLEDLGCCQHICLDCKTGHVFCTAPSASDEEYELGLVTDSLEDYLKRWLQGEMLP
jgi:SMI1 / KNR4 family (SUKH-1)